MPEDDLPIVDRLTIARGRAAQLADDVRTLIDATPLDDPVTLMELRFAAAGAAKAVKALGRIYE